MKGKDLLYFILIILLSFACGFKIYDKKYDGYSDLITFLSIMIGFKITSLSILFHSPLKKTLFDRKIGKYQTELHRLRDYYKHSLIFDVLAIVALFILPEEIFLFNLFKTTIVIGKHLFVLPILLGSVFCFYKITSDLFKIFTHPTN
ncbi:MAG: hypothetical protein JRJ44_02955 [Deltaproteobacteria bacterium]|nr:hypothetical protein [Deltaproteobacteria bacterium]